MKERKLDLYLKKVGAHIITVLGEDTEQVTYWENCLRDVGYQIEPLGPVAYVHAVVVLDKQIQPLYGIFSWTTVITMCPDYTADDYARQALDCAVVDTHSWNGIDFVYTGHGAAEKLDDPVQITGFWENILQGWPDLAPYVKDTYILYAGAGTGRISDRRNQDLVEEINQAFLNGYTRILFYNGDETSQADSLLRAQRLADFFDIKTNYHIPQNTFIYVCGSPDARDTYDKLSYHYGFCHQLLCRGYFRFELMHRGGMLGLDDDSKVRAYLDTPYQLGSRDKRFLNFNRVPRPHRMMLASKLYGAGLLDQGYMSFNHKADDLDALAYFQNFFPVTDEFQDYCMDHINFERFIDDYCPMVLNRTPDRDNPVEIVDDDVDYYRNSYFSIVTETVYYENDDMNHDANFHSTFLSEKTWKPIMMKHPFVLVGCHHSLHMLRNIGYKTFHPYIDETYDVTHDAHSRMLFAWREIERLIRMSDAEWLELQRDIAPIVEYNFKHFCDTNKKLYIDGDSIAGFY